MSILSNDKIRNHLVANPTNILLNTADYFFGTIHILHQNHLKTYARSFERREETTSDFLNFTTDVTPASFKAAGITVMKIHALLLNSTSTLTATRVFNEVAVRPRVPQYQVFSARYSHQYFSNANRSSGGLKNDLSFRLIAILKPLAVVECNEGKCGIDHSDQMVSYTTTIRKGIKLYRKLGIQLLLEISIVNTLAVYKIARRKDINIRIFRELLAGKLLGLSENTKHPCLLRSQHNIAVWKNDSGRSIRRACKLCNANKRRRMDRTKTQKNLKKTITYCPNCPDQPQLCIECFKVLHSK